MHMVLRLLTMHRWIPTAILLGLLKLRLRPPSKARCSASRRSLIALLTGSAVEYAAASSNHVDTGITSTYANVLLSPHSAQSATLVWDISSVLTFCVDIGPFI